MGDSEAEMNVSSCVLSTSSRRLTEKEKNTSAIESRRQKQAKAVITQSLFPTHTVVMGMTESSETKSSGLAH